MIRASAVLRLGSMKLLTAHDIARRLGVSVTRVRYVLATRDHIEPVARFGITRVFAESACEAVRLALQDTRSARLQAAAGSRP